MILVMSKRAVMLSKEQYELMTLYLASFYDVDLYERHGVQHPLVNYAPQAEQVKDIDSILGHFSPDIVGVDSMVFYNYAYLHTLQNSNPYLFNGTTFVLKRLRTNPLRIDAVLGKYFDMLATCAWLEEELLEVISTGAIRLAMRSQYHRGIAMKMALTHGKERSAAIGCAMLVVFNDAGIYKGIIARRTEIHGTHPHALHVMPAFIFQQMGETMQAHEWSIKYHAYREWLEEFFGMAEGDSAMNSHPALLDLQGMEAEGRAEMCLTGISMNLLTLRPEINIVLVIHDREWWQRVQSGQEAYQLNMPETNEKLLLIPIDSDEAILSVLPEDYYLKIVPQAIPALWEGIDMARKLIR
jgi:hypothetical protein